MRTKKISALALVAVAAGLSLTACSTGAGDTSAAASVSPDSRSVPFDGGQGNAPGTDSAGDVISGADLAKNAASGAGSDSDSGSGSGTATAPNSGSGSYGSGSGSRSSGSGASASRSTMCHTANLGFTTSHGMAEGQLIVNMKNKGSASCTMHGFPGVDFKGPDGTVSAARSKDSIPTVKVAPGDEARFTVNFPTNQTGGSGITFTSMIVTPPNETHSYTLHESLNVPVSNGAGSGIFVRPVGVGK
jgi:hypothetical protein